MKRVTCQAVAERQTFRARGAGTVRTASRPVRPRAITTCGSHASAARAASSDQKPKDASQLPPKARSSGTDAAATTVAPAIIAPV
ncbi:hypothetical protein GCM10010272_08140 [Streptomyces lateritius]|nr:hypothetical protein GCM10010272_08140 [Streptomyces lateritius]